LRIADRRLQIENPCLVWTRRFVSGSLLSGKFHSTREGVAMLLNLRRTCLALALSLTLTRVAAADELPKKVATDLLGDPLPQGALARFQGHTAALTGISFSPDGKTLATSCDDGTLRLWDTASGKERGQVAGHEGKAISACAFAPDGKHLWSAGRDNTLRLWDSVSTKERRTLLKEANVFNGVALAASGRMAATGTGSWHGSVFLWELPTGKKVAQLNGWWAMAFSPDNEKFVHQVTDGQLYLHDLTTGRMIRRFPEHKPGPARTSPVAFSPDGRTLATVYHRTSGFHISLWETTTAKQRLFLRWPLVPVQALAFSPDGRLLAVSAGKSIRLWDLVTGKPGRSLEGHQGDVIALAFSSDGRALASASKDTTALLWDMTLLAKKEKKKQPAFSAKNLEDLWDDLGRLDAAKAYQATWLLTDVPDQTIALFKPRLQPAVAMPIERWIAELDDKVFAVRQKATADLASHVEQAEPALRRALAAGPSLEATRRIERLLAQFSTGDTVPSTDLVRSVRAIEVLERIGTAEAKAILTNLARGAPDAWVTREARGSLERLTKSN
jgi:WD40 repeat protein